MPRVDVSVLVPVLNEAAHLRGAIASMLAQSYPGSIEYLFIDGGSTDGSREIITEFAQRDQRIRLLENPDRTTPRALNRGLCEARGEFVARMDAHARYPPKFVEAGVERLKLGSVVHVTAPSVAVGYDCWSRRVALALRSPLGVGGATYRRGVETELEVDAGFTGLWPRAVLIAHGGWNDDAVGDEDYELSARLRKDGGRIVTMPQIAAAYSPRNSLLALARQYWVYGQARTRTSRLHPESLRPSQLLPATLALTLGTGVIAPRALARWARAGMLIYGAVLIGESRRALRRGAAPADATSLPAVFAAMHLAYGLGSLAGAATYGVPVAALAHSAQTLIGRARRHVATWSERYGPSRARTRRPAS